MDNEYFLNAGISPPVIFEPAMQSWNSFPIAQELSCSSDQTSSFPSNPNWDKQLDHFTPLHSMLPSPAATLPAPAPDYNGYGGRSHSNDSCFSPFLNSHPKPQYDPLLNQFPGEISPNLGNSLALNPVLPALSADPGFVQRAAKFSCFGSRSFNERTNLSDFNNSELPSSAPITGTSKLPRVWSTPVLKQGGSSLENKNSYQTQMENKKLTKLKAWDPCSNEGSSVSEQVLSGETGSKAQSEVNSKKRKAVHRSKAKEDSSAAACNAHKGAEADDLTNEKRLRTTETGVSGSGGIDVKGEAKDDAFANGDESKKQEKTDQKPTEPPKDYIHVRARRGQATDSHSLAERVRREKISERMKLLQDLVPGCNKVTGKALMLDEIINYVKSLQSKVEFLSMKLASVDPSTESNMDDSRSKIVMQADTSLPHAFHPENSSVPSLYGRHLLEQSQPMHTNPSLIQYPVGSESMDTMSCHNHQGQLLPLNGFSECLPQFRGLFEDELHSIVQMGFSHDVKGVAAFHPSSIPGHPDAVTNQRSDLKLEL